jgi:hypothetical protein
MMESTTEEKMAKTTRKPKQGIVTTLPSKMHWEALSSDVTIVGPGHYPDTVMVDINNKDVEVCINDLRKLNG